MPTYELSSPSTNISQAAKVIRAHVMIGESVNVNSTGIGQRQYRMIEDLPILKGILQGVRKYHNARMCQLLLFFLFSKKYQLYSDYYSRLF